MRDVETLIIGGGISGATALHRLASAGRDALLIEATGHLGGMIGSYQNRLGALVELGPNSIQRSTPELDELLDQLNLGDRIVTADPAAANRYILRNGHPVAVPRGPGGFLRTPLLTTTGKLRLAREPFVAAAPNEREESVAHFIRRRLGTEVLEYAVDPFVSGIFAGVPESLSLKHAFPKLYALEQDHGGLLRGMIARRRQTRRDTDNGLAQGARRSLISFDRGMMVLPHTIEQRWRSKIRFGTEALSIARSEGDWIVETSSELLRASRLVVATSAFKAATLLELFDKDLTQALLRIEYPPVAVAVSLYDRKSVAHPLDGFGMLVPRLEGREILGVIFSSSLFPNRAPEGLVALTTFIGGARQPELALAPREQIADSVHRELSEMLGITAPAPSFDLHVWRRAIPQYNLGYGDILAEIDRAETRHPGLKLLGNYRGGVSVGDCVRNAFGVV